jgi:hypothetical protein
VKKSIIFEFVTSESFAIKIKRFVMAGKIRSVLIRKQGKFQVDKDYWLFKKEQYLELLQIFYELTNGSQITLEPIPTFVFRALSTKIPFQQSKRNIIGYDYSKDAIVSVCMTSIAGCE